MCRRSHRSTAGRLPERYRDDFILSLPNIVSSQKTIVASSASSSHARPPPPTRPSQSCRPRVPIPAPDRLKEEGATGEDVKYESLATNPAAILCTEGLSTTTASTLAWIKDESSAEEAMDVKHSRNKKQSRSSPSKQTSRAYLAKYLDGTWMDEHGRNVHFLDKYYDEHVEEYEAEKKKDKVEDLKGEKNGVRLFPEAAEHEAVSLYNNRDVELEAFEKWLVHGESKHAAAGNGGEEMDQNITKYYTDKKFAALHFKLQWHMILEAEEDLIFHPPRRAHADANGKPFRYAQKLFGINGLHAISALEKKNKEARNKIELMPQRSDYEMAKEYLKEKGLPSSLIAMYNYLDQ
ncbi:uncharacterized protein PV09_00685 [Verruconis gallopava]|uniref:Uncharacterized protein n=1 Tax=Verruconis gallopava TaxID=253628 RepID=A0A0D1Z707_9PEZI|nr:uncharacterized protein PV09_00685 [Verruconis gallopava]KIW08747.1 hypothetical protein PV09_00685 [Verruconis gallopava]